MRNENISSVRNEKILYVIIWVVFAILPLVLELWKFIDGSYFQWKVIWRWWVGMIPLIIIFLLHNHILIPKFMKKGRMVQYCVAVLLILTLFGGAHYMAEEQRREEFKEHHRPPPMPDRNGEMPPRPFPFPFILKMMLAAMTIGMNSAISLSYTYHREQADRKELENNRLQEELKYLKQQISPHFLMNVLNNIHEMAEENIKEAQDMILELSYLMRYVLYDSENERTTLSAESRFISSYVALMKRRYVEGIVKVSLELQENISENIQIPPLLFISFIENAFKHGISYNNETFINIRLYEEEDKIVFLCDNTIPQKKRKLAKGGVGLSNVKRRLDLLYGDKYKLLIDQNSISHSVKLIIPCR